MTTTTRLLAASALTLVSALPAFADTPLNQRNIIFVLVDDLRYDGMGFVQPNVKTPNIDKLAAEGTYFPNAVVTSSLCSPSRATILTGMTARNHRIVDNNDASEEGLTFFPSYLQDAGYQTAFIGKWHMGMNNAGPRPGFDEWLSFEGQGFYTPTQMMPPKAVEKGAAHMLNHNGTEVKQTGYITNELTDYAINWLDNDRDPQKPFFLYLSHKAVHSDPVPDEKYAHQYDNVTFDLPVTSTDTPENRAGKPRWVQDQRNSWHGIDFMYASDQKMSEYLKNYYATLSSVDDSVGELVSWIQDHKLEEKTAIVFYSDNGFLIGDHGLIDKRNAYEGSIRVPMVVWAPGLAQPGSVNDAVVRNVDLAPTFLDIAGAKPPAQFEGKSALPLISGKVAAKDWGTPDFVYEYYWEWTMPQTPTTFAIERNRLKYIQYHGIWDLEELYDLAADPLEQKNLIDDPAHLEDKIALRKALYEQLANTQNQHAIPYGQRTSAGVVQRKAPEGVNAAPFPESWLRAPNDINKLSGVFPDSPQKAKAIQDGVRYLPPMR